MSSHFYHSFPRRRTPEREEEIGLAIIDSICRNGLLLVPEKVSWRDPTAPNPGDGIHAVQRRICFTELREDELTDHSAKFGRFAIEFSIENLRSMGALPVIYVPDHLDTESPCNAVGTSLLANLAASAAIISTVTDTLNFTHPTLDIHLTMKTGEKFDRVFSETETAAIKEYIQFLQAYQGIPFHEMRNAIMSMSSIFYPTENPVYTGTLGYYRQREWRIVSGFFVSGEAVTQQASESQAKELLTLDKSFFSREIDFADGRYTLAQKSHFMREIGGKHVLELANRFFVPESALGAVRDTILGHGLALPVDVTNV